MSATPSGGIRLPYQDQLPKGFDDFWKCFTPSSPRVASLVWGLISVAIGAGVTVLADPVTGALAIWAVFSLMYFGCYTQGCSERGMFLVELPWRQSWTWAFLVFTLPWALFWGVSALRFVRANKRLRAKISATR